MMRDKFILIIAVIAIICIGAVCGTILLTTNNKDTHNNSTNNNTTINSTVNETNKTNDTNNTTAEKKTSSSKYSNKKNDGSSSSDKYIEGNKIESSWDVGEDTQRINTKNDIYYKDKKTGKTSKRHLDSDGVYRYYPI